MAELSARDSKLVQYLNEAYGKEKELETALQAHIGMTSRGQYKKRLQQHLAETKGHARELERRIKSVGGSPDAGPVEGLEPFAKGANVAIEIGSRAVAAAQGPIHAIRGTGEQEKMLKNAKTEYANEHEEIATYTAIETLAEVLSDSETARLARSIRREEERMAKFLERLIPTLTRAVTQDEIPPEQRRSASSRGRAKTSRSRASASSRNGSSTRRNGAGTRGSAKASRASSGSRTTSARRGAAASKTASKGTSKAASKASRGGSKATTKSRASSSKTTAKASRGTTRGASRGATKSTRAGSSSSRATSALRGSRGSSGSSGPRGATSSPPASALPAPRPEERIPISV